MRDDEMVVILILFTELLESQMTMCVINISNI